MSVQLGLGLNRRQGGFNPFTPTHLNPYLLFDTRTSMLGELESPTLDLNPAVPSSLDVITATRSGVATYTDADGLIQTADPNTVRVDHVDGVPMMLIEPSATNGFTHSEGINNYSTFGRANCTYSLDSNPFGGFNSSCKITSDTFTNNYINSVVLFNSVTGESNYFTFRVKKKNGWFVEVASGNGCANSSVRVGLSGEGYISSSGTTANSYLVEEFDDYFLIGIETLQTGTTTAGLINLRFYNNSSFASYDLDTIEEFFVTGIQWENNSTVATSYIPTSGSAVTRAADDLVIDGSDFTDFYNQSEGTFYVEVDRNSSALSYLVMIHSGSSANYLRVDSNGQYRVKDASVEHVNMTIGSIPADSLARVAFSYKYNDFRGSVDGGSEVTDNSGAVPAVSELQIGAFFTNSSHINGHIKRLIYWPTHSDSL